MRDRSGGEKGRSWLSWAVLLALLIVALALRWRYVREISLFVDEFVTAWAARNVLAHGLPLFPSGNIYPHGFLFTYLVAPFVSGSFDETLARLPGLIVGLAGLPVAYWVGRRLFSAPVGLFTAAALAVDPDAIVWGARARMYGLLQLLTLLVVYFFYRGLAEDRPRDRYLAMALLVAAVFTHAEAAFLLPVLGLAALLVAPSWKRLLRPGVLLPFALAGAGVLVFYLIDRYGQPGHLETLQESRPYLSLSAEILQGPRAFAPYFFDAHRLPFTLLAVAGFILLVRPRFDRRSVLTTLYVLFLAFSALLILLAGTTWQRERYLFLILPLFFLIAGQVLWRSWERWLAPTGRHPWGGAAMAALVALYVGLTGSPTAYVQEWGYDLAFRHLRGLDPAPEDRIATSMSTAAMLYLGRNDAFAIQEGYEEYVIARPGDGRPADLWTATPMLTTTAEFVGLLREAPRTWFVVDGWRFQTRYEPAFIQTVLDQMEPVYGERGILIFRGEGFCEAPRSEAECAKPAVAPAVQSERRADFNGELALAGFDLSATDPLPGDTLDVALRWRAQGGAQPAYTAFLHLVGPDGVGVAGVDEPLLAGLYQPDLWPDDWVAVDRHSFTLPPDLPPGRYRLDLGLYPPGEPDRLLAVEGGDRLPLAALAVGPSGPIPAPAVSTEVDFGGQLRLRGYDLERDTGRIQLALYWQALAAPEQDYTAFVHLLDRDGTIVTQSDAGPGDPFFPTSTWLSGAEVLDLHILTLPADLAPGDYTLVVGLYHPPTEARLQATDARGRPLGDAVPLVPVPLGSPAP